MERAERLKQVIQDEGNAILRAAEEMEWEPCSGEIS